jgi:hypothetical protein
MCKKLVALLILLTSLSLANSQSVLVREYPQKLTDKAAWRRYIIHLLIISSLPLLFFTVLYQLTICLCCKRYCVDKKRRFISSGRDSLTEFKPIVLYSIFLLIIVTVLATSFFRTVLYYRNCNSFMYQSDSVLQNIDNRVNNVQNLINVEIDESVADSFSKIENTKLEMFQFIDSTIEIKLLFDRANIHLQNLSGAYEKCNLLVFDIRNDLDYIKNDSRLKQPPPYKLEDFQAEQAIAGNAHYFIQRIKSKIDNDINSLDILKKATDAYIIDYRSKVDKKVQSIKNQAQPVMTTLSSYMEVLKQYESIGKYYARLFSNSYMILASCLYVSLALMVTIGYMAGIFIEQKHLSENKYTTCVAFIISILFLGIATLHLISFVGLGDTCRAKFTAVDQLLSIYTGDHHQQFDIKQVAEAAIQCKPNQTLLQFIPGVSVHELNISEITDRLDDAVQNLFQEFNIEQVISQFIDDIALYFHFIERLEFEHFTDKFNRVKEHLDMIKPQLQSMTDISSLEMKINNVESNIQNVTNILDKAKVELINNTNVYISEAKRLLITIPRTLYNIRDSMENILHSCKSKMLYLINNLNNSAECSYLASYYSSAFNIVCKQSRNSFGIMFTCYLLSLLLLIWIISVPLKSYRFSPSYENYYLQQYVTNSYASLA